MTRRFSQIFCLIGSLALLCLALAQTSGCDATPISLPGQPGYTNDRAEFDAGSGGDVPTSSADAGVGTDASATADAGATGDSGVESRDGGTGDQGPTDGGSDGEPSAPNDGGEGDTAAADADGLSDPDGDQPDGM